MRSLQSTLMLWIGGAIAAILIAAGSVIYLIVGSSLHQQFDEALERSGRTLPAMVETDDAIELQTDHDKLRLVFRNLIENAISYSPDGSAIEIVCEQLDNVTLFQITNEALNLMPSDMQHVFERFWRADKSRSQTGQHSGLGLSLCRSLIELLGGTTEANLTSDNRFAIKVKIPMSREL